MTDTPAGGVRLIRSPVSVAGMVLTTASAVLFLVVFLADLFGLHTNPYIGIVFFLVLPALFLVGLVLIPLGAWIERRRREAGLAPSLAHWPRVDLNDSRQRTIAVTVFGLTMANIVIVSLAAYRGVEYMDSVQFCSQACHGPMAPEGGAREGHAHATLRCVDCHVGPGASSFARAKMAGTRRVVAVAMNNYPRPIVALPEDVTPARDSCERCHDPARDRGEVVRRIVEYANDAASTESVTTLRLHVGGADGVAGRPRIHWHAGRSVAIDYVATGPDRQTIPWVRVTRPDGTVREYTTAKAGGAPPAGVRRRMDCLDCHNRPSHVVLATVERAVDQAIEQGELSRALPFARREAVKALQATYPTADAAARGISRALGDFYRSGAGGRAEITPSEIERAIATVSRTYRRNVFPEMKVTFGTYPSNIGHVDAPGCFRCHDDDHVSSDGRKIGQDCETCHAIE